MVNKESTIAANDSVRMEDAVHAQPLQDLERVAADPTLSEDLALSLLKPVELPPSAIEHISKSGTLMKLRKVRLGLISHPRAPRHLSLPLLRHLYTFDLMSVALAPIVPGDVKKAAEEVLVTRLGTISAGEKLSLARRASGRIAEQLLLEREPRIVETALQNSRLTEASIVRVLARAETPPALIHAVCHHLQWSQRREVRMALLRNEKTPLAKALEFAQSLSQPMLQEILEKSALPTAIKSCLLESKALASANSHVLPRVSRHRTACLPKL
jgi:hypothetical protein